jgi:hypothetical protein
MNRLSCLLLRLFLSLWSIYILKRNYLLSVSGVLLLLAGSVLLLNARESVSPVDQQDRQVWQLPEGGRIVDGSIVHECRDGDTAQKLMQLYYSYSRIFTRDALKEALIRENTVLSSKKGCKKGDLVKIPDPLIEPVKNRPLEINEPVRAIYLRGENAVPNRLSAEVRRMKQVNANGIVFDVKDISGVVNYRSSVAEVEQYRRHPPPIPDLPKMIDYLHRNGIYVIARVAMFQDENLATVRPDLAIVDRNSPTGRLLFKGRPLWVDPGRPEVQMYNLKIIHELVGLGVDEIQLDYIRYPAEGDLSGVSYYRVEDPSEKTKHLTEFLAVAWILTRATNVRLAVDVFGVVAWGEEADRMSTGQRLEAFAPYVDVVSPMLYPSHFNRGYDGFEWPADQPVYFYTVGNQKVRRMMGPNVIIRPWLQAFKWRVSRFNENYILQQIEGSNAGGGYGWMMWNAGNEYGVVYRALAGERSVEFVDLEPRKSKLTPDA